MRFEHASTSEVRGDCINLVIETYKQIKFQFSHLTKFLLAQFSPYHKTKEKLIKNEMGHGFISVINYFIYCYYMDNKIKTI